MISFLLLIPQYAASIRFRLDRMRHRNAIRFCDSPIGLVGYAGVLGGGEGTGKTPQECNIVTKCITPQSLQLTIQIARSIALLLSIPVMLNPSTKMLEVMLTDHNEERKATGCESPKAEVPLVELRGADNSKRQGSQILLINQAKGTKKDEFCKVPNELLVHSRSCIACHFIRPVH